VECSFGRQKCKGCGLSCKHWDAIDALTAENAELRKVLGNLTQEVETWDACDKHNCANYRPVLPWPESEGWWWCSNGRLYEFVRHQGKYMAWWDDGDLTDADLYSLHYPGEQAPRFTRLLEPNPFGFPDVLSSFPHPPSW